MSDKPKRRWFQFGLADAFVLMTLLGIAWWLALTPPPKSTLYIERGVLQYALRVIACSAIAIVLWLAARRFYAFHLKTRWGNRPDDSHLN